MKALGPFIVLLIGLLGFEGRTLLRSQGHAYPIMDEVRYLELARDLGRRGGWAGMVGCYLRAECREDTQHPLYPMLLARFMRGIPEDFARAKLATLLCTFASVCLVYALCRRRWGANVALATALAILLSPSTFRLSTQVLADTLFAGIYFACVLRLILKPRGLGGWLGFGGLVGAAYLTKGDGHFLFLSAVACAAGDAQDAGKAGRRRGVAVRIAAALAGFAAVSSFLWIRNLSVWGNPFHNHMSKVFWTDADWEHVTLAATPEWDRIGPAWYLRRHGLGGAVGRFAGGLRKLVFTLAVTMAVGPNLLWARLATGLVLLSLSVVGLWRAWRSGERREVRAIGTTGAALCAAFAWCGGPESMPLPMRYLLPIAWTLLPMAMLALRDGWLHWTPGFARTPSRRLFLAASAAAAAGLLALNRGGLGLDPVTLWSVPDERREASSWIRDHVDERGILVLGETDFSMWDCCRDLRWIYPGGMPERAIRAFISLHGLRYAILDRDGLPPEQAAAYSRGFLGWRRCQGDGQARFLIYAEDCATRRAVAAL